MALVTVGDLEVGLEELVNHDYLSCIDKSLDYTNSEVAKVPVFSWFYKKLKNLVNPDTIVLNGDLLGHELTVNAGKEAENLYELIVNFDKLVSYDSLDDSVKQKLNSLKSFFDSLSSDLKNKLFEYKSGFTFDDAHALENVARVYADILFDEGLALIDGSAAGSYKKLLDKLEGFAVSKGVDIAFILGNHDLDFGLFKARYDKINYSKLHFIDRAVKKIGRYWLAGFGGSPETPNIYKKDFGLRYYCSNSFPKGADEFKKELGDFKKNIADFKVNGCRVDALVLHKGYEGKVDGDEVLWGVFPNAVPLNEDFIPGINGLIDVFNPDYVISGHWHDSLCFKRGKTFFINPGQRGSAHTRLFKSPVYDNKPNILVRKIDPTPAPAPTQPQINPQELVSQVLSQLPADLRQSIESLPPDQQAQEVVKILTVSKALSELPEEEQQRILSLPPVEQQQVIAELLG